MKGLPVKATEPEKSFNSGGVSELSTHQAGNYATIGISELEQVLKLKTFTRSEVQRLIAVLNSRITNQSPSDIIIDESDEASSTSGLLKKHKVGDSSDNFHDSVVEEHIASPSDLVNAYKGSYTISTDEAPRQDSKLIDKNATSLSNTSVASPQHPTTMENLPDELLSNIFMRLLSKQLAQMRSVSKSWNSLLSQSSFLRSHLLRSTHKNDQILLVFYHYEESYPDFKTYAAFRCRSPYLELTNFIKLPVNPGPQDTKGIEVIGSINGLICSSYDNSVIQIWNPSLSAMLTLPPYSMPSEDYDPIKIYLRFGFDPKTNDYKVVKLTGLIGPPPYVIIKWWLQIEIYSMRKGTWELITERFPSHITRVFGADHVCADGHNGRLHWLALRMDLHTIVALDLGSETFREIPLPHSTLDDSRDNILGILAGKLCLTSQLRVESVFEVWVMEEYGVADSWVKRHVLSQFSGPICPFGFGSLGEFFIEVDDSLVLYDPVAKKQKVLEDYYPEEYGVVKIVEYVDSLVWVAPAAEHEMVDGGGQN